MSNSPQRVIVISDLHIGPGGEYDFFSARKELCSFLDFIAQQSESLDLVILGDALDFLQLEPALEFTEKQALAKTKALIAANQTIFDKLAELLMRKDRRVVWAIGNHDIELLFDAVRDELAKALKVPNDGSQLLFDLHGGHRDYASKAGTVRLVHGNVTDAWNWVDYELAAAIIRGEKQGDPYPAGSHLVAEVLHRLRKGGHGYIDMLKPEASVALPLAIALWPEDARDLLKSAIKPFAQAKKTELQWALQGLLGKKDTVLSGADASVEATGVEPDPQRSTEDLLAALLSAGGPVEDATVRDMTELLLEADDGAVDAALPKAAPAPGDEVLAGSGLQRAITWLLQAAARRMNSALSTFDLEEDDENDAIVRRTLKSGVKVVVAGHTHLARAIPYPGGCYINTGTWADLMRLPRRLPREDFALYARRIKEQFEEASKANKSLCRPFQRLTYADLDLVNGDFALRQWVPQKNLLLQTFP